MPPCTLYSCTATGSMYASVVYQAVCLTTQGKQMVAHASELEASFNQLSSHLATATLIDFGFVYACSKVQVYPKK